MLRSLNAIAASTAVRPTEGSKSTASSTLSIHAHVHASPEGRAWATKHGGSCVRDLPVMPSPLTAWQTPLCVGGHSVRKRRYPVNMLSHAKFAHLKTHVRKKPRKRHSPINAMIRSDLQPAYSANFSRVPSLSHGRPAAAFSRKPVRQAKSIAVSRTTRASLAKSAIAPPAGMRPGSKMSDHGEPWKVIAYALNTGSELQHLIVTLRAEGVTEGFSIKGCIVGSATSGISGVAICKTREEAIVLLKAIVKKLDGQLSFQPKPFLETKKPWVYDTKPSKTSIVTWSLKGAVDPANVDDLHLLRAKSYNKAHQLQPFPSPSVNAEGLLQIHSGSMIIHLPDTKGYDGMTEARKDACTLQTAVKFRDVNMSSSMASMSHEDRSGFRAPANHHAPRGTSPPDHPPPHSHVTSLPPRVCYAINKCIRGIAAQEATTFWLDSSPPEADFLCILDDIADRGDCGDLKSLLKQLAELAASSEKLRLAEDAFTAALRLPKRTTEEEEAAHLAETSACEEREAASKEHDDLTGSIDKVWEVSTLAYHANVLCSNPASPDEQDNLCKRVSKALVHEILRCTTLGPPCHFWAAALATSVPVRLLNVHYHIETSSKKVTYLKFSYFFFNKLISTSIW